ncbi:cysteine hydrolase family protein [Mesobacillus selenatarsenatis]|uniref:Isochorismatase n=1 Tax=Mesobacillus selenatarsenatis (strain DSM 18680 / JCM 14380 / FERM P-15431 / SF-1) TaxID=1321606 RepID=A0A0A8X3Z3_MESS1|nr:cysteine hydrolase family protein [Mesobacillus selenatarsenatis]GAM14710.1 isochorismatase [Mesobacillus selenatarsenatis SF-1]
MENSALVIIDVQNGMFLEGEEVFNGKELLQGIKGLIKQARLANIPIVYIQHNESAGYPLENGTYGWEIHSEISPDEGDIIIQKTTPDSFLKTSLDQELKEKGIEHLYLAGIQTEVCVDTTCRSAFSKGYKVTLVSDLHSTWDGNELTAQQIIKHHNGTLRWFADVRSSDEIRFSAKA